ncbi:hypothetical protein PPACK8108_LOCUS18655 [Phakopsora pachyrhizi]|uniref:Uncharacterized protein n=1 Tax=Phakopsora pachyrhizi TaxID=170000 RepID=A0AAV0BG78_PHAPC|nr:hypothetical protein PPACK8108_LOCUS18655 [Phakopsora pachyrhizi]
MRAIDQGHGHNQRMSRAVGEWGVTQKGIFSKSIVTRNKTYKNPIKPDWRPFCERQLRQEHLITPGYRRRIQSRPGDGLRVLGCKEMMQSHGIEWPTDRAQAGGGAEEIGTHYKSFLEVSCPYKAINGAGETWGLPIEGRTMTKGGRRWSMGQLTQLCAVRVIGVHFEDWKLTVNVMARTSLEDGGDGGGTLPAVQQQKTEQGSVSF